MYIVTYVLVHVVVMGQLAVNPDVSLSSLRSSLQPGLAVCVYLCDEGHQLLQQDIYSTKVKGNKENRHRL